jgi:ammonium transporter Rh
MEMVFYTCNEAIASVIFNVKDKGGSMTIHTFGASFGLAASYWFSNTKAIAKDGDKTKRHNYYSAVIAMIGTLFLFVYLPSFNAALNEFGSAQQRAIINTLLANTTAVISAFYFCRVT